MPAQIIHRADHNDIPVLWSDIRSTYSGALIFGVGVQDESVRKSGVTHLLEHLVMSQVGEVNIAHNATTDGDTIAFYAQGPSALVADFLNRVGESIRSLDSVTDAAVAAESSHIAAELGEGNERTGTGPLLERYGAATLGLLDLGFPAHRSLTLQDALEWARTWLHAGNAVLAFSGPVPDALELTLPPAAQMPQRSVSTPLPYRQRGWLGGSRAGVALSFDITHADRQVKYVAGVAVSKALLEELRQQRHLIYSVDGHTSPRPPRTVAATLVLDPQPADILATAEAALGVLRSLANEGPSQSLLDRLVDEERNAEEDSDALYGSLIGTAGNWIRTGAEPLGIDHSLMPAVSAAQVRDVVAAALDTLLVHLGDFEADLTPEAVTERLGLPWARPPQGHYESLGTAQLIKALMRSDTTSYDPKMFSGGRGQQIIVDPERLAWTVPNYGISEFRWDQIVLAGRCAECGLWDLTDRDGGGMLLQPKQWRSGDKLTAKVVQRVDPQALYPLAHAAWH